ncbi:coleoptile phototropism protein 1-like [Cucurbita pepo subsp. pepo]|uniref:coleoptile phototropism protein 1-like n=1 Tax=Cucurbita pepo subsp. pepo TaxID=3664 RepID=UPI000C9D8107|nr:coleoptile phototropism protein 1-like [Cucurbita pepo subsp. pepo]
MRIFCINNLCLLLLLLSPALLYSVFTILLSNSHKMKHQSPPQDSGKLSPDQCYWFHDSAILDIDYFVKTLAGIKAKGVRTDLIGSVITHYASKWLPDLSDEALDQQKGIDLTNFNESPQNVTNSWMKKKFFVETLVGVLPPERDLIPCNFLLRLLRTANMVGVEPPYKAELEKRITWQLDQASLKEVMIPSFSHTCGTVLDVELVIRLVKRFVNLDDGVRSGAALVKVAKLVDCYLAEAAMDSNLGLLEFVELAGVLPSHARASDDGLYRAIDTYLKAHPNISKQERKSLCRLMDSRKLSTEASLHAAQNDRLPVRAVIQVLFSEQTKLNYRHLDWSGSIGGRSPSAALDHLPARCQSKREITAQQMEIKKLKETVVRLQNQCNIMQAQMERLSEKKRGFFKWRKFGFKNGGESERVDDSGEVVEEEDAGFGRQTPVDIKTKLVKRRTPTKTWRKSVS